MISGVSAAGAATMVAANQQLAQASQTVAQNGVADLEALTKAMVGAQQAQQQAAAGAKMIAAGDEALGRLIDAFA